MSENQLVEQGKKKEPLASRVPLGAWIGAGACAVLLLVIGTNIKSPDARNLILFVGGAVGLGLAAWRGWVLQKQAEIQQESLDHSQQVARRDSRFEIKRLAMEQLASDKAIVREAGVVALITAMEDPDEERPKELAALLSNYIGRAKYTTGSDDERIPPKQKHVDDAIAALRLFGAEERRHGALPDTPLVKLNLPNLWLPNAELVGLELSGIEARDSNLSGVNFYGSKLVSANFSDSDLSSANLQTANLKDAVLYSANLSMAKFTSSNLNHAALMSATLTNVGFAGSDLTGAILVSADLAGARFSDANLTEANFSDAKGMAQEQLDRAEQHPDGGPPQKLPDGLNWDEEAAKERWLTTQ